MDRPTKVHDFSKAMTTEYELYHGTAGAKILSIMDFGAMRPDTNHEVYFSQRFDDALQHGADSERRGALAFKARVTIPDGASIKRVQRPGNPLSILVTTALPLPVAIQELYVRRPGEDGFELEIVKGVQAIRAALLR